MTSNAKRDAAWEKYKDENKPKGQAKFYYKDNRHYWCDGYSYRDAEVAELDSALDLQGKVLRRYTEENESLKQQVAIKDEVIAVAIDGLESYCEYDVVTNSYPEFARKALHSINTLLGREKV